MNILVSPVFSSQYSISHGDGSDIKETHTKCRMNGNSEIQIFNMLFVARLSILNLRIQFIILIFNIE